MKAPGILLALALALVGCGKAESANVRPQTLGDEIKEAIVIHYRQAAHDPDRIEVEVLEVEPLSEGLLVTASIRGKNTLGAKVLKVELFYLVRAEKTARLVVASSEDGPKRFAVFQLIIRERSRK